MVVPVPWKLLLALKLLTSMEPWFNRPTVLGTANPPNRGLDSSFGSQCEAFESEATKIRSMGDQRTWRIYSQHFPGVPATVEFIHEWTERAKL